MKQTIKPLWVPLGVVAAVTIIRSFFEFFSNPEPLYTLSPWYVTLSYFLCFVSLVIGIGYIISVITKEPSIKWVTIMAKFSPIILLAPIIDLIWSKGEGICMGYLGSGGLMMLSDLLTFFGPLTHCGISPGMRIEIALILIALGRIVWIKTRSMIKTTWTVLLSYLLIFATGAIAGILGLFDQGLINAGLWMSTAVNNSLLQGAHGYLDPSNTYFTLHGIALVMGQIHLITAFLFGIAILIKDYPNHLSVWIRNSRWERVLYYWIIALLGGLLAVAQNIIDLNWVDGLSLITASIGLICACWAAAVWNDFNDITIDEISNSDRPLHSGKLSRDTYATYGTFFFVSSLVAGLLVNYSTFLGILLFQIVYGLYSFTGTLWKKNFVTAGASIALVGTIVFITGYLFIEPNQSFERLPTTILFYLFGTLMIISHAKDFKDVRGDRAANIKTLPVLLGKKRASLVLSLALTSWVVFLGITWGSVIIALQALPWIIIDLILRMRIPEPIRFIILFAQIGVLCLYFF